MPEPSAVQPVQLPGQTALDGQAPGVALVQPQGSLSGLWPVKQQVCVMSGATALPPLVDI